MLTYIFSFIIIFHGLIHFMGFAKAFGYGNITQLTQEISKPAGSLWLLTAFLFIAATVLFLFDKGSWPVMAIIAAILSQVLIIGSWKEAKFGTIVNILVLLVAIAGLASRYFESQFSNDVTARLQYSRSVKTDLLTETDLQSLPQPVQSYLRYCGVVNQPKVKSVRIMFNGEMRGRGKDWFRFQSVQYNFFDAPARLFFMKATMWGFTVPGYHYYQNATACMEVKLFGLFPVMQASGGEMDKAETVTVFNDMCLAAPATLINKNIRWEPIDSLSAKAVFTNGSITISAILYFNEKGQLINFISDDRYAIDEMRRYRFSTPVKDYQLINGRNVFTYGETVWHYPEGPFTYGKFYLERIDYNVDTFKIKFKL